MPKVLIVILAGGRGNRLGTQVKANLKFGGQRLVQILADRFAIAGAGPVLISSGNFTEAELQPPAGTILLPDRDDGPEGPAAGLHAACGYLLGSHVDCEFVFSVAVDTPFLPLSFINAALEIISDDTDAVVAASSGQIYPTNAVWKIDALVRQLDAGLPSSKGPALRDILPQNRWKAMDMDHLASLACFNINTPADLATARQLWAGYDAR